MRFSLNLDSVFTGESADAALAEIRALGFSTCERWAFPASDDAAFSASLAENGLRFAAFCPDFFTLNDPSVREEYLRSLASACTRAKAFGCGMLITQVGMDTGAPRDAQRQAIVDGLREAMPLLREAGVTLVIEPLNDVVNHPGYFLTSSDEGFAIVEAVDSPHVRLLYDIYHQLHMKEDVRAQIEKGLPLIGHFHMAGFPNRDEHFFDGAYDYRPLLEYLSTAQTDALIGLEFTPSAPDARRAILSALLRAYPDAR